MKRNLIVGDVHGSGQELERLIEDRFKIESGDRLFFVGDLLDRGKHAHVVWKIIKKYGAEATVGNHEYKMASFLRGERNWLPNHYYYAINDLYEHGVSPAELLAYIDGLPLLIPFSNATNGSIHIVTHAGVLIDDPLKSDVSMNVYGSLPPEQKMPRPLDRDKGFWWDKYDGDIIVVYGHLVTDDHLPRIRRNTRGNINSIGLDTAAVHGGPITGYCADTGEFFSYKSGKEWFGELKQAFKKSPIHLHPEIERWIISAKQARYSLSKSGRA